MSDLLQANALSIPLANETVQTCVTSPPYWGLRDYGEGDQLGLEPTPEEYIASMVAVFREVWRVLRADGTLWLNLGDSYARQAGPERSKANTSHTLSTGQRKLHETGQYPDKKNKPPDGLKPKDLVGIPWRVALALQADGWYLRSDIIWHKPNPMPESVTDRPTKSHEYIFLMAKNARYYYDADAVREEHKPVSLQRVEYGLKHRHPDNVGVGIPPVDTARMGERIAHPAGRNKRDVWTVTTKPYSGAHFATFPPDLIEPCIKAGTPERGSCAECGAPWERVVERKANYTARQDRGQPDWKGAQVDSSGWDWPSVTEKGWQPTCNHEAPTAPALVLDPFGGSGTTGLVSRNLGRRAVCLDLSWDYLQLARERLGYVALDNWTQGVKVGAQDYSTLPMFGD